jgi:hypothetical protein
MNERGRKNPRAGLHNRRLLQARPARFGRRDVLFIEGLRRPHQASPGLAAEAQIVSVTWPSGALPRSPL